MHTIAFIDTEIDPGSKKVLDIGCVKDDGRTFHEASIAKFLSFLDGSRYICGHNIIGFDLKYIGADIRNASISVVGAVDTLYLSPLLFPKKPYHKLLKDDKLQNDDVNNPLSDAMKAKDLFHDEVAAFWKLEPQLQDIYYQLLHDKKEFCSFFTSIGFSGSYTPSAASLPYLIQQIRSYFKNRICSHTNLAHYITDEPIELAYCLALINTNNRSSITPPWVVKNYPAVERIMHVLRNKPCLEGCAYCNEALDIHAGLKRFFHFDSFRTYAGKPLQESAVQAAVDNKSLLAVFPTGGGKSITFQLPALMSGENTRGLTVVISPLQSLMKDQVDNLEKIGITEAVTINGLLDPIERAKAIHRVENGAASILYISPESLRSKTIERLLLGRNIVRFVIDEAHCFSSWGHDFRVDYLYIGDFIKQLQEKKNLAEGIPVSCFTATAKSKVIEDICKYFKDKLGIEMEVFRSDASRTNLSYAVFMKSNEDEKYNTIRDLLDEKQCPTIIYVSRTARAYELATRLTADGYTALPYHGKMDKQEKSENQDAFISGKVSIMVATSAFGMGVDKKDVGMVIHFDISDSLENYVQEAGRAGRDASIHADCYVLFNDEDLSKHFILLNQTKLSHQEIQQVWAAIKKLTAYRSTVTQSALEIATEAGWGTQVADLETRVKTAITALEECGYIRRGQNVPRVYANSILVQNVQDAVAKIKQTAAMNEIEKGHAVRIVKKLLSTKSRRYENEESAESRVDYISDHLGIPKEEVVRVITLLRQERILADSKDLTASVRKTERINRTMAILNDYAKVEAFLLSVIEQEEQRYNIKELVEMAEEAGCTNVSNTQIKTILNIWTIKNWVRRQVEDYDYNRISAVCLEPKDALRDKMEKRHELSRFIAEYLFERAKTYAEFDTNKDMVLVEFSVLELKEEYERQLTSGFAVTTADVEDALFAMSRIGAMKLEGGFMVTYISMNIERLEQDNRKRYKQEDYSKLETFYKNKIQQIHIVGEYARMMVEDYEAALRFVNDYFTLNYSSFLNRYFKGSRQDEIARTITPTKFRQLFGELSPTQLKIINDSTSRHIVVAAGPGSGKTRILVHKLASLLLMEDVKSEQLLMVTFSRSAATEFKKRLLKLIGNAANFVEIKTFHSYCFDLLGRVGTLERSQGIIRDAVEKIRNGDVDPGRITKTVLVIDEAQDMDDDEYALITTLMEHNEDMRVIAVGDDDQNIYEFRGSSSKHVRTLITEHQATLYELVDNYRSKKNLVEFTNQFVTSVKERLKSFPIVAVQGDNGVVRLVHHEDTNLITPVVNDILDTGLVGSTCVLTTTNEDAMKLTGLLRFRGMPAKLIQSNDGFNLYNLVEIRHFLGVLESDEIVRTIDPELWNKAKRSLVDRFSSSPNLNMCLNMIRDFEVTNPKTKYMSDLRIFIRESQLEDFLEVDIDTIFVSTIHKAKGREFDNVFLLLDRFILQSEESKRLLYVALTRAKSNLVVHYTGNLFQRIIVDNLERVRDYNKYGAPSEIAVQLTHRDIYLDYFMSNQETIATLNPGDKLYVNGDFCFDQKRQDVLRFSKQMIDKLRKLQAAGYHAHGAIIKYIVYWKKDDSDDQVKIVMPEITCRLDKG